MSLLDALTQTTLDLANAEAQVKAHRARQAELQQQVLDKYCPLKVEQKVPIDLERYLRIDTRSLTQDAEGVWHWVVAGTAFDVTGGGDVMVGDNFHCRRRFELSDTAFAALPAEVRHSTVEALRERAWQAFQAKQAKPLTLSDAERQLMHTWPEGFFEGRQGMMRDWQSPVPSLTNAQADLAYVRLMRKGVIQVGPQTKPHRTGPELETMIETMRQQRHLPLFPGPRAIEAAALLDPPSAASITPPRRPKC